MRYSLTMLATLLVAPFALLEAAGGATGATGGPPPPGKQRVYYIACEEEVWDYAPTGRDVMTQQPLSQGVHSPVCVSESLYLNHNLSHLLLGGVGLHRPNHWRNDWAQVLESALYPVHRLHIF